MIIFFIYLTNLDYKFLSFSVEPVSDDYDDLSDLKPSELEQVNKNWRNGDTGKCRYVDMWKWRVLEI